MAVKESSPEDLIRSTKPVTLATAKVVAAGNSGNQEEIAAAANLGRNAVTELLTTCKVSYCNCNGVSTFLLKSWKQCPVLHLYFQSLFVAIRQFIYGFILKK